MILDSQAVSIINTSIFLRSGLFSQDIANFRISTPRDHLRSRGRGGPDYPAINSARINPRTRKTKTQEIPNTETFSDLLKMLPDIFDSLAVPEVKSGWLPQREIAALKKIGVYVPTPWLLEDVDAPSLPCGEPMPIIASCSIFHSEQDENDISYPRFAFAMREASLPAAIAPTKGTPYRFGYQYMQQKNKNSPPEAWWHYGYIVVGTDGLLRIPMQMTTKYLKILHKKKSSTWTRWTNVPTTAWAPQDILVSREDKKHQSPFSLLMFRQLILWWNRREDSWSVSVRRDGKRATFSIAPKHTAAYFADRELTVDVSGRKKKIVHYVREHDRANGSRVKAHVRGLSEFNWNGFDCVVTAPKLRGNIYTTANLNPTEADESLPIPDGMLDVCDVTNRLADHEDRLIRPIKSPSH